jgi:phosphate starvation-inducible PhoH-like protein
MTGQTSSKKESITIPFYSLVETTMAETMFRKKIGLMGAAQKELGIKFEKVPGNHEPIAEVSFNGTKEQAALVRSFFEALREHIISGGGLSNSKIHDVASAVRAGSGASKKSESAPESTTETPTESTRFTATVHFSTSPHVQRVAHALFVSNKKRTPADYIQNKFQLKISAQVPEQGNVGEAIITGGNEEKVGQAKELFQRLIKAGQKLNQAGLEAELLTKTRLDIAIDAIRNGGTPVTAGFNAATAKGEAPPTAPATFNRVAHRPRNGGLYIPTPAQEPLDRSLETNALSMAIGPAGVGKTYTIAAKALEFLKSNRIAQIVLTRSVAEAGEGQETIGFLPGTKEKKMEEWLFSFYDAIDEISGVKGTAQKMVTDGIITVTPLGSMRGRSFRNSMVICVEGQNLTKNTAKMLMTRIGNGSILAIDGDPEQNDMKHHQVSGLSWWADALQGAPGVGIVYFEEKDVKRSALTRTVLERGHMKEEREAQAARAAESAETSEAAAPQGARPKVVSFRR